jgi:cytochrome c-type biogenesis protein
LAAAESALGEKSLWAPPLVFLAGLCTSLNPCVYPTFPVLVGYVCGQKERGRLRGLTLGSLFLLGLAIVYVLEGLVVSFVGDVLGLSRVTWACLLAAVCITTGIIMAGLVPFDLPSWAPLRSGWNRFRGAPGALAVGALFGLVATPCATPVLVLILSVVARGGSPPFGALLLFLYAVGHGLPGLLICCFTGAMMSLGALTRYTAVAQRAGGWLLVAAGLYLIWQA